MAKVARGKTGPPRDGRARLRASRAASFCWQPSPCARRPGPFRSSATAPAGERLVFCCRKTSASTAPCTSRRMCCPTHCASYCAPCQPVLRAFVHLVGQRRRLQGIHQVGDSVGIWALRAPKACGVQRSPNSFGREATDYGIVFALRRRLRGIQGYLAHKKTPPPDPTVGLCLGS